MGQIVRNRIFKNAYRDSVELMRIAAELERLPSVSRAGMMMATPANREVLVDAALLDPAAEGAGPSDLIVAVAAEDEAAATSALDRATALLAGSGDARPSEQRARVAATIYEALVGLPTANLVLVSTPGPYATAEALKALKRGLHVFLFSDNVPVADEIELKQLAERKGLLVMGPDCGTAIIDGIPLGFANVVRPGRIGLIGASGTGLQQVSCLVDRLGEGISQAIGVGGRDLDERVGGRMTLAALRRLAADGGTAVIVLISKPPAPAVAQRVLAEARGCPKPVVANFLGGDAEAGVGGVLFAETFEDAARTAVALARGVSSPGEAPEAGTPQREASGRDPGLRLAPGQDAIRGLYCGGSLAGEAKLILHRLLGGTRAQRYTVIDLGDDEYTVGRPHPMIDPRLRNQFIVDAARDPQTAVILLDVVLGYNAHPDPAGALVPALEEARREAGRAGRQVAFVASVCGTAADPQGLGRQEACLESAEVLLAPSNAQAAQLAARLVGAGAPATRPAQPVRLDPHRTGGTPNAPRGSGGEGG
ncbi:MAG TPA: acyl-CoA synthetase FdrA [bacterium]|nr:acyl-CoA synthetase FdrA [bacterium]